MLSKYLTLAEFRNGQSLRLEPAPNGGWIVYCEAETPGVISPVIGAFSSPDDMISALTTALIQEETQ